MDPASDRISKGFLSPISETVCWQESVSQKCVKPELALPPSVAGMKRSKDRRGNTPCVTYALTVYSDAHTHTHTHTYIFTIRVNAQDQSLPINVYSATGTLMHRMDGCVFSQEMERENHSGTFFFFFFFYSYL